MMKMVSNLFRIVKDEVLGISMNILGYYPDDFIQLDLNHNSARINE